MKLESKVGAFFIGTILILGVLIMRTEKLEVFGKPAERTFRTEFAQVAGLNVQGHVLIAGVKVGTVKEIAIENIIRATPSSSSPLMRRSP